MSFYKNVPVTEWRVLDDDSLSDHRYVAFSVDIHQVQPIATVRTLPLNSHPGWSVKRRDPLAFASYVESHPLDISRGETLEIAAASTRTLDAYLLGACDSHTHSAARASRALKTPGLVFL